MQVQVLFLLVVVGIAMAYPEGAPMEACGNLTPQHNVTNTGTDSQVITLVPHMNCYKAGSKIMVLITAGTEIEGIMAMAKKAGDATNAPVGTWELGPKLQTRDCSGQANSAITHMGELETYGPVGLVWVAPDGFTDPVIFRATIVHHTDEYWVDRQSTQELTYDSNCADVPYEVPVYIDSEGNPRDGSDPVESNGSDPVESNATILTTSLSTMSMITIVMLIALL